MILLTVETEHHRFEACGNSEGEANHALEMALRYHGRASGLLSGWWIGHYDITTLVIEPGECFRDGQLLYRNK
jgi:hypothetical protein